MKTANPLLELQGIPKGLCDQFTVWDRVPKEDAANFESDTFLRFAYVVNISKIKTFLGRF